MFFSLRQADKTNPRGLSTLSDHAYVDLPSKRTEATPCPALTHSTSLHPLTEPPTHERRRADTVRCLLPGWSAVSTGALLPACLPACLRCLPAKSDAVIAPCAADRASFSLSHTPLVLLWLAVAVAVRMWSPQRNAFHPSASIAEEDEMFFPLSPVPLPPSEHHPVLHLPHRR